MYHFHIITAEYTPYAISTRTGGERVLIENTRGNEDKLLFTIKTVAVWTPSCTTDKVTTNSKTEGATQRTYRSPWVNCHVPDASLPLPPGTMRW